MNRYSFMMQPGGCQGDSERAQLEILRGRFVVFCAAMNTRTLRLLALIATFTTAACDDDEGAKGTADGGTDASTAGDSGAADSGPAALLDPPAPGKGVQFTMTSTIAAGQDVERCKF